jgi:hypothetical protein
MNTPVNKKPKNCVSQFSDCVIWDGPNIPCVGLCTGDSVTDVVYKLGALVCTLSDNQNVENYNTACLTDVGESPNFQAMLNNIIVKLCALQQQVQELQS